MRGHDQVIAMRLKKRVPAMVFVNDYPCRTDWLEVRDHATVCTFGDAVEGLDLRFLVGLRVSISATTEERAKALFARVKAHGAALVAAVHVPYGPHAHRAAPGWCEVWERDAQGVQHG